MLTTNDLEQISAIVRKVYDDLVFKIETLDLKIETFRKQSEKEHSTINKKIQTLYQQDKKDHQDIMNTLAESNEIHGQEQRKLGARITKLENHPHLV